MKDSILMAIESLCDDIATDTSAEDNRKRAEAIADLAVSGIIIPDDEDELNEDGAQAEENAKLPKPGEIFSYNGVSFVTLGIEQGGLLAIVAEPLEEEMQFNTERCNDWRKSSLRKYLNGDYLEEFGKEHLLPFTSDLTSVQLSPVVRVLRAPCGHRRQFELQPRDWRSRRRPRLFV